MTSTRRTRNLAILIGVGAVCAGTAAYFFSRADEKTASNTQPAAKEVVIEEHTLKQLKSLGYTN